MNVVITDVLFMLSRCVLCLVAFDCDLTLVMLSMRVSRPFST
jgi:hypothetical protein